MSVNTKYRQATGYKVCHTWLPDPLITTIPAEHEDILSLSVTMVGNHDWWVVNALWTNQNSRHGLLCAAAKLQSFNVPRSHVVDIL